jgi:hypothetical protein
LFDTNSGEHGDVTGDEREHAREGDGDDAGEESPGQGRQSFLECPLPFYSRIKKSGW